MGHASIDTPVGLARLAVRPLVEELQRVLDESTIDERGGGLLH
jgi:hypothetical protein